MNKRASGCIDSYTGTTGNIATVLSGISHPASDTQGQDTALLEERHKLYEAAKASNPQRWSGKTRNWKRVNEVWLNPPREIHAREQKVCKSP
uniref:Transposase n=1 Tax=Candidatus Kentrum sp. TUN TaxID=2126343 RepID=A0A450ZNM3_9GAMM|nr:MAG: hypothetical protein BECKTUN1418F_GA0071002_10671 [Candidatus Kentron sp. TUN]VFK61289.1 MAG: hypothetical protein BECKTUN1418E_GA0071001_10641 [Candidatus Kentron sp. TUN]